MKNKKRRILPVAIALVAIVALSGVAYAYWSSSGSGTGAATAGDSAAPHGHQTSTTHGPRSRWTAPTVVITVANPADFSQSFSAVAIAVTTRRPAARTAAACRLVHLDPTPARRQRPSSLAGPVRHCDVIGTIRDDRLRDSNQDACKDASIHPHSHGFVGFTVS